MKNFFRKVIGVIISPYIIYIFLRDCKRWEKEHADDFSVDEFLEGLE